MLEKPTRSPLMKYLPELEYMNDLEREVAMFGRCPCGSQVIVSTQKTPGLNLPAAMRCPGCGASAQVTIQMAHENYDLGSLLAEVIRDFVINATNIQQMEKEEND